MAGGVGHIQINVRAENLPFYYQLFSALEWSIVLNNDHIVGVVGDNQVYLWLYARETLDVENSYDGPGMNHLALTAPSIADVDRVRVFLESIGVSMQFETPKFRPDLAGGEDITYYQIMFESPDRVLFEYFYQGYN